MNLGEIAYWTTRLTEGEALITEISEWFFDGKSFDASRLEPAIEILGEEKQ